MANTDKKGHAGLRTLIVVKPTGENFIRHYYPAIENLKVARSSSDALRQMTNFKPDLVLFEWANDLTAKIIDNPLFDRLRSTFTTVVRIHDHEVSHIRPDGKRRVDFIDWSKVDRIWFISPAIMDMFQTYVSRNYSGGFRAIRFFCPNAANPALFAVNEKRHKKAGFLSIYPRPRKGIERVLQLAKACPDWEFCIRTHLPESDHQFHEYWKALFEESVYINNVSWQHRNAIDLVMNNYREDDLRKWYRDKAIILSTSHHEGFHYAVAQGLLTGCDAIVWNWPGAKTFWKPYVVNNIEGAIAKLKTHKPGPEHRKYVESRYSPKKLWPRVIKEITKSPATL